MQPAVRQCSICFVKVAAEARMEHAQVFSAGGSRERLGGAVQQRVHLRRVVYWYYTANDYTQLY